MYLSMNPWDSQTITYLRLKELRGKDRIVEIVLQVGGVTVCIMRENRIFSSDHKASEHMQKGAWALWEQ